MKVIMTVSPIRHKAYGLHADKLSKARLLLAADTEIILFSGCDGVRPLRIVVAQRDKEIQSFFLAVALHHLQGVAQGALLAEQQADDTEVRQLA